MSALFFVIVSMQKEKERFGLVFFQIATTTKKLVFIIWFLVTGYKKNVRKFRVHDENENLQNLGAYWWLFLDLLIISGHNTVKTALIYGHKCSSSVAARH